MGLQSLQKLQYKIYVNYMAAPVNLEPIPLQVLTDLWWKMLRPAFIAVPEGDPTQNLIACKMTQINLMLCVLCGCKSVDAWCLPVSNVYKYNPPFTPYIAWDFVNPGKAADNQYHTIFGFEITASYFNFFLLFLP